MDERNLIAGCASGNAHSWDEFARQYGPVIRGVAQAVRERQCAWRIDTDDMVSHVYENLLKDECRRLRLWRGEAKFRTFLVHLANNACIDYLRVHNKNRETTSSTEDELVGDQLEVAPAMPDDEDKQRRIEAMYEALKTLSPQQQLIIKMRLADVSLRDIARALNIPEGTVFVQSSRAIDRLRKAMRSSKIE